MRAAAPLPNINQPKKPKENAYSSSFEVDNEYDAVPQEVCRAIFVEKCANCSKLGCVWLRFSCLDVELLLLPLPMNDRRQHYRTNPKIPTTNCRCNDEKTFVFLATQRSVVGSQSKFCF
jgi:hypothetical protein